MAKIPFDEKEMTVASEIPNFMNPGAPGTPVWTYPCSPVENEKALFAGEPHWCPAGTETGFFCPSVIPDHNARGFIFAADRPADTSGYGGKDMFGVEWEYVPLVGGSMVRPGKPMLEDANDWEKVLQWPDIEQWDWEGDAKKNEAFLHNGKANFLWLLNGAWYERLVSFMEFEGAAMALIDEEQKDAVKALFEKTTELYCRIVDKCCEVYGDGIVGFTVHDDWGAQAAPFFSPAVGAEMIVPYMKKLTDCIHSHGKIAELHSCGKLEAQVGNFVAAGWDAWTPMGMNDYEAMYDAWGDKIVISCGPAAQAPDATYEEQVKAGEEWVARFFQPGRYAIPNYMYFPAGMTRGFREGLYRASRQ